MPQASSLCADQSNTVDARDTKKRKGQGAESRRFCAQCGHLLAHCNPDKTCFRHPAQVFPHLSVDPIPPAFDPKGTTPRRFNKNHALSREQELLYADEILEAVCRVYDTRPEDLYRYEGGELLREARQVASYLLLIDEFLSVSDTGKIMHRHTAAVYYGFERIKSRLSSHPLLADRVKKIQTMRKQLVHQ